MKRPKAHEKMYDLHSTVTWCSSFNSGTMFGRNAVLLTMRWRTWFCSLHMWSWTVVAGQGEYIQTASQNNQQYSDQKLQKQEIVMVMSPLDLTASVTYPQQFSAVSWHQRIITVSVAQWILSLAPPTSVTSQQVNRGTGRRETGDLSTHQKSPRIQSTGVLSLLYHGFYLSSDKV